MLSEENICDVLNQSEYEDDSDLSDDDVSYVPQRNNDRDSDSDIYSRSSSVDGELATTTASPVFSVNSERRIRVRTRGRRGSRRVLMSRSRHMPSTRSSSLQNDERRNCWTGENLEPIYRDLQQPAYLPNNI